MDTCGILLLKRAVTSPRNFKVNFLVVGAQKGGTTAFHDYLAGHPQICLADKKEVHFFDTDEYFYRRHGVSYVLRYRYYHSHFKPQPWHHIVGEATPSYMYRVDAPRRIWEYNPKMKLIMVLRDPVTRAFSHWNMERERGTEALSFWESIQRKDYDYVDRGFYTQQLRRIWHLFPLEQTLIFKSEELKHNPHDVMHKTHAFLGLDDVATPQQITSHARDYPVALQARERQYLQHIYEDEIKALEQMLGWDCSDWGREPSSLVKKGSS